jgi:uncharacterized protein
MNRKDALESIQANVESANMIKHMLATEAVMRGLAKCLGHDEEEWGITGLLHDIDVELTEGDMSSHGKLGADLVKEMGGSADAVHAVLAHNSMHGIPRDSMLDKALYCADPLTGLITAAALVRPDKKLSGVEASSVKKRFNEKGFAAGVDRAQIALCSEIGLGLDEFIEVGLEAIKRIAPKIGL